MWHNRTRHLKATQRVTLALLLTLGLAACGSGGDGGDGVASAGGDASTSAGAADGLSDDEKALKFAECMRENGVDMEDPKDGEMPMIGEGVDMEDVRAATEACEEYAPGEGGMAPGEVDPEMVETMREMAECMRANGVPNFPDPDEDGRSVLDQDSGIDPEDPTFQAAQEECNKNGAIPGMKQPGGEK